MSRCSKCTHEPATTIPEAAMYQAMPATYGAYGCSGQTSGYGLCSRTCAKCRRCSGTCGSRGGTCSQRGCACQQTWRPCTGNSGCGQGWPVCTQTWNPCTQTDPNAGIMLIDGNMQVTCNRCGSRAGKAILYAAGVSMPGVFGMQRGCGPWKVSRRRPKIEMEIDPPVNAAPAADAVGET